jgi:hypothetical protein
MTSKKKMAAVVITIAALSLGSVGVASAHDKGSKKTTILADLVTAGTITQAQADAITQKFQEAKTVKEAARAADKAAKEANRAADKAAHDAQRAAFETLVATTIGIDAATIKTRIESGETLAAIAGAKKDDLIAAIVAFESTEIDARVTAGKITAAQATEMKANLTARVTDGVNGVGPKGMGHNGPKPPKGPEGFDGPKGPKGPMGPMGPKAPKDLKGPKDKKGHGPRR